MEGVIARQQFNQYSRCPGRIQRNMAGKRAFSRSRRVVSAAQYPFKYLCRAGLARQIGRMTFSVKRRRIATA